MDPPRVPDAGSLPASPGSVAALTADSGTDAGGPAEDPFLHAMGVAWSGNRAEIAKARAEIATLRKDASPKELVLLDRCLAIFDELGAIDVEGLGRDPTVFTKIQRDLLELLHDWADAVPKEVRVRRMYIGTLHTAGQQAGGPAGAAQRKDALAKVKQLVLDFPEDAGAHSLRASIGEREGEDPVLSAREYSRCITLDPANAYCRTAYKKLAQSMTDERCAPGGAKSTLSFREAFSKQSTGPTKGPPSAVDNTTRPDVVRMTDPRGAEIFVSPRVILRPADFVSITRSEITVTEYAPITVKDTGDVKSAMAKAVTDPPAETKRIVRGTRFVIAPAKRAAFASWSKDAASRRALLAILDGTSLILSARAGHIEDSFFSEGLDLETVCAKTVRPTLPAGLPPPDTIAD